MEFTPLKRDDGTIDVAIEHPFLSRAHFTADITTGDNFDLYYDIPAENIRKKCLVKWQGTLISSIRKSEPYRAMHFNTAKFSALLYKQLQRCRCEQSDKSKLLSLSLLAADLEYPTYPRVDKRTFLIGGECPRCNKTLVFIGTASKAILLGEEKIKENIAQSSRALGVQHVNWDDVTKTLSLQKQLLIERTTS